MNLENAVLCTHACNDWVFSPRLCLTDLLLAIDLDGFFRPTPFSSLAPPDSFFTLDNKCCLEYTVFGNVFTAFSILDYIWFVSREKGPCKGRKSERKKVFSDR